MKALWFINQSLFASIGGILGYLLGGLDAAIYALVTVVTLDYLTGVVKAWHLKTLSSHTGFIGIAKKVAVFVLVALANIIDTHVLGETGVLRTATIFFYLSNEGISILENCAAIGLPIPERLKQALDVTTKKETRYQPKHAAGEQLETAASPPAVSPPAATPQPHVPSTPKVGGTTISPTNHSFEGETS